jgi:hypothetical protein
VALRCSPSQRLECLIRWYRSRGRKLTTRRRTRSSCSNTPVCKHDSQPRTRLSASSSQSEASLSAGASAGHGETLSRTSTVSVNVGSPPSGHLSTSPALLTQGAAVASVPPGMPHLYLPHLQHRLMMEPSLFSLQQSQQSAFMPVPQKPPQSSQPTLVSSPSLINSNVRQMAQMGLHAPFYPPPLLSTTQQPSVDTRQQQQQHQQQGLWCVGPQPHFRSAWVVRKGRGPDRRRDVCDFHFPRVLRCVFQPPACSRSDRNLCNVWQNIIFLHPR